MANVITIADREFTVQRFRGFKAVLVVAAVTEIAQAVPDILADVTKEYRRRNTVIVTESMSRLPAWSSFTTEEFDKAEAATGRREIEIPSPMSSQEQLMQALPRLLTEARDQTVRLLALLIIPNDELKAADKGDTVDAALDEYRDLLLYEAELDQLAELALVGQEVLTDQLEAQKDRLGKLLEPLVKRFLRTPVLQSTTPTPTLETDSTTTTSESPSTLPTSTDSAPTSSTDSPAVTVGTETQPSMASPGVSS